MGLSYAYYSGTVGAERESPLPGGGSALGLEVTAQLFSVTGIYVWDTGEGRWNFASVAVVPFAKMDAEADLRIGSASGSVSDSDTGLFDMAFVPVIASRHFSATQHLSLALYIFAPTGSYEEGRLAELSLNNWTYSPTVGYTQLFQKGSISTPRTTRPITRTARCSASIPCWSSAFRTVGALARPVAGSNSSKTTMPRSPIASTASRAIRSPSGRS
jgi:hypothetical protein